MYLWRFVISRISSSSTDEAWRPDVLVYDTEINWHPHVRVKCKDLLPKKIAWYRRMYNIYRLLTCCDRSREDVTWSDDGNVHEVICCINTFKALNWIFYAQFATKGRVCLWLGLWRTFKQAITHWTSKVRMCTALNVMLYLSRYGHIFKIGIFWLLQFHHRILQYTYDISKFHDVRCMSLYWLLDFYLIKFCVKEKHLFNVKYTKLNVE